MKLIQVYECLCDETRLRIVHLLTASPLCVSHLQTALQMQQVKVSKHLIYLKERGMVVGTRCENWVLYSLATERCSELDNNLRCLQDCIREYPIFREDLERLKPLLEEVTALREKAYQDYSGRRR